MFRIPIIAISAVLAVASPWAHAQSQLVPSVSPGGSPDGILRPWKEADAATTESGLVHRVLVKVGDVVQAGQPLAELDCDMIAIQLETARTQAASEGRLMTAKADAEFHKRKVELLTSMRLKNQANDLEEERARIDLRMAEGRLRAELDERRVLQLQVQRLEEQLRDRVIKAPIDGVVVKLHKEIGEVIAVNAPQVARIADVSKLKATFYLTDEEVRRLQNNKDLRVRVSSGQILEAHFDYVLPYANDESGLIEMQVIIDNPRREVLGSRCQLLGVVPST